MKSYISMKRDDFEIELEQDFNGNLIRCFFKNGEFLYCGNEVKYRNILVEEGFAGRFNFRIGHSFFCQYKEGNSIGFYFSEGVNVQCIRRDMLVKPKAKKVENQDYKIEAENFATKEIDGQESKVSLLYNEKIEQFRKLYKKIKDKEHFKIELKWFISTFLDEELFESFYGDIFGKSKNESEIFQHFFEKYVNWEDCFYYVYSNISLKNIKKLYPNIEKFYFTKKEMEEIVETEKEEFDICIWGERDEDQDWLRREKDKKKELEQKLKEVYKVLIGDNEYRLKERLKSKYTLEYVLKDNVEIVEKIENIEGLKDPLMEFLKKQDFSNEGELKKEIEHFFIEYREEEIIKRKKEILKSKYTVEYVIENNTELVRAIENFEDMKFFLGNFLMSQDFSEEIELKKELILFFEKYKKHENEYNQFIEQVGKNRYILEYSECKEAKYYACKYEEDERIDAIFMEKILSCFYDYAYISGTTKYRPNFERIPFWTLYVKELVDTFLKYEILKERNGLLEFYKPENINQVDKEKLYFSDWQNGDSFLNYKEQRKKVKEKKYLDKIDLLGRLILADSKFLSCKSEKMRLEYLSDFITREFEEGRDNYLYCLEAYKNKKKKTGLSYQGEKAKNFIEQLWVVANQQKK